jgi:hypothetical protein
MLFGDGNLDPGLLGSLRPAAFVAGVADLLGRGTLSLGSMTHPLDGVRGKIARAKRHLAELKEVTERAVHPDSYETPREDDGEIGKYIYRVYGVPAIDPKWSVITGDVLFNLRSALEHLAWQLVLLDGGTPTDETKFPILKSPPNKGGVPVPVQLKPKISRADILDALDRSQPYRRLNGTPQEFWSSQLWALNELHNIDKHRLLLIVVSTVDINRMGWGLPANVRSPKVGINFNPLKDGDPVAWFDFHGAPAPEGFDPNIRLQIVLRQTELPPLWSDNLVKLLDNAFRWIVEDVIVGLRFAPLFYR